MANKIFALLQDYSCYTRSSQQPIGKFVTSKVDAEQWVTKNKCCPNCNCYGYKELKQHGQS